MSTSKSLQLGEQIACKKSLGKKIVEFQKPYLFVLPILIFAVAFSYYPFIRTLLYSLSAVNKSGEIVKFVGLKNYLSIFSREEFINAIGVTLKFTLIYVPIAVALPYTLALIANRRKLFSNVYQTLFALPMAVSVSASCYIFQQLLHRKIGLVNYLLEVLGFMQNKTNIDWLGDKTWALPSLAVIMIWIHIGFNFMLLLAAVRNVPDELIEAANLEGCGYWRKVFKIVIPITSPTIFFVFCTQMVAGIMMNAPTMILTKGGPVNSTSTMIYYVYTTGFRSGNFAIGSTASIATFLLAFIFLMFNFLYEKKGVVYD